MGPTAGRQLDGRLGGRILDAGKTARECPNQTEVSCRPGSCRDRESVSGLSTGQTFLLGCLLSISLTLTSRAGDWPQILGPNRDGKAVGESLPDKLPDTPTVAWEFKCGEGFAGPAVANGVVYLFHRQGDQDILQTLDLKTGKPGWETKYPATYRGGINSDRGPRCVPTVQNNTVLLHGAGGHLHAIDATTGKAVWTRDTWRDFNGLEGYFGAGSSPIIFAKKVVLNTGGRGENGVAAFDLKTGKTLWQAVDERASYSAPIAWKGQAIFITRLQTLAINPENGELQWQVPFGKRGPTVNGALPVVADGHLFLTASYGIGARWFKLPQGDGAPAEIWSGDKQLSSQYATPIYLNGFLYGSHGREDVGRASFRCIEAATGEVKWEQDDFGMTHVIGVGDQLLIHRIDGQLQIATANPEGLKPKATWTLATAICRSLPAFSQGHYLYRINRETDSKLVCLRLATR